jgi:hypothetical protein
MNQQITRPVEAGEILWPTARQCKWIDGDPKRAGEWSWCLAPVATAGAQYCAAHQQVVYTEGRPR